ncbi:MAG TPA: TonB-dependent receptor, partial [Xanthomonadales bacterium]|nr:TonB-dependent receptor [Xanthomonadales bacterium]
INAGAAYLESEYGNFSCTTTAPNPIGGGIVTETNCKGNDLIRAPNFTGNVGAAYTVPMASGSFKATMNWYFNGGFYWEPDNVLEQDAYNVLNAELSWTNADGNMRIRVFGANLTDEKYSWYSNSGGLGFQISAAPPLTFGAGVDFYW